MVLISNDLKFIYFKNKKCASTSVENYFIDLLQDENILTHKNTQLRFSHTSPIIIKNYIGDEKFNNYFKFCVIRNPYDRLVSYFYHFILRNKNNDIEKDINKFRTFVKSELPNFLETYTIDSNFICDYHIRYENLEREINYVCEKFNLDKNINLKNIYSNIRPKNIDYKIYYDSETKTIVENKYKIELDKFGYDF